MNGIPCLKVVGKTLPEAWEKSVLELYNNGGRAGTQYDRTSSPTSIDCSMWVVVENPLMEPMIHKAMPCGLDSLEEYRMEVMEGVKNHWIRDATDPTESSLGKWEYTYNQRLMEYSVPLSQVAENDFCLPEVAKEWKKGKGISILLEQPWVKVEKRFICKYAILDGEVVRESEGMEDTVVIDQIQACVDMLAESPHTRRAQAIVWKPWEDLVAYDPACLQSIWLRVLPGSDGPVLNMNVRFRSRDAFKAAFMNMYVLICWQEDIARRIGEKRGEEIKVGRYTDLSDSYHIYGDALDEFERFRNTIESRSFEDRVYRKADVQGIMDEARNEVFEKIKRQDSQ